MAKKLKHNSAHRQSTPTSNDIAEREPLRIVFCTSSADGKATLFKRLNSEPLPHSNKPINSIVDNAINSDANPKHTGSFRRADRIYEEIDWNTLAGITCWHLKSAKRIIIAIESEGDNQAETAIATAASIAEIAVILVDVTRGVSLTDQRQLLIASLMGIDHVALVINKMDLADFNQDIFDQVVAGFKSITDKLHFKNVSAFPVSALLDDNIESPSEIMPWYKGVSLLDYLNSAQPNLPVHDQPLRFSVQSVSTSTPNRLLCSGTVLTGRPLPDYRVRILPSGELATIEGLPIPHLPTDESTTGATLQPGFQFKNQSEIQYSPQYILQLYPDNRIGIKRGDILTAANSPCEVSDQFEVSLVWSGAQQGFIGRTYTLLTGALQIDATITDLKFKYDISTYKKLESRSLSRNDIAKATISLEHPIPFETIENCRLMGAFVLLDPYSFTTVAAGRINFSLRRAQNVHRQALFVDKASRERLNGHPSRVLWFTGLSGSGKSTIANAVEQALHQQGIRTYILDGDNIRQGLNKDLGFTDADRIENIRRIAEISKLMVDAGLVVLTAFISPFRSERDMARALFKPGEFFEIHVDVPLNIAEERDPKGLYKKARNGQLPNFTGIDSAYEEPAKAEIVLATGVLTVAQCVERILEHIQLENL